MPLCQEKGEGTMYNVQCVPEPQILETVNNLHLLNIDEVAQ